MNELFALYLCISINDYRYSRDFRCSPANHWARNSVQKHGNGHVGTCKLVEFVKNCSGVNVIELNRVKLLLYSRIYSKKTDRTFTKYCPQFSPIFRANYVSRVGKTDHLLYRVHFSSLHTGERLLLVEN